MAFVTRSERNFNLSEFEANGTYPGEFFNESSYIKNIDRQSPEFQSNSVRNPINDSRNDVPGPGSYGKILINDDYYFNHPKKSKTKDIYEAVKNNLMSKEIIKFIEKNQGVAFNTRGDRFNYSIDELEKKSKLPGPGSYSPNGSLTVNGNTDYSSIINNNNQSSSKKNFNASINFPTTYSSYRTETIPSKGNLGYEFDKSGQKKMINNPSDISKNKKKEKLGPGCYNVNLKWDKNAVKWEYTQDDKDPKYEMIKYQKNFTPLNELEQEFLENKKNTEKKYKKNKTMTNINKNKDKNAMFKYFMSLRYNMLKNLKNKKELEKDIIFEDTPGPGYYDPENNKIFYDSQYSMFNNKNKCFQSTSPRFKKTKSTNCNIGPGYYEGKTKPLKVKKDKLSHGKLQNQYSENLNSSAFRISMIKEKFKIPGPGTYELMPSINKNNNGYNTNNNFGFNEKRFKINNDVINFPGPGFYNSYKDNFSKTTTNSLSKNSFKNDKIYKNFKSDLMNVDEINKIEKEKFSVPPIGLYNPNIVTSIDYANKSKINSFVDQKVVGFGTQEKKNYAFTVKEGNKFLGPGLYYKTPTANSKQNVFPFNQKTGRFQYKDDNLVPGPGSYELNSVDDWHKKSHNILFV